MRWLVIPVMVVAAHAGCAVFPSDPVGGPPVGIRIDDAVITVLVPECATNQPLSAEVVPTSAASALPVAWKGSGFNGTADEDGIRLAADDWQDVAGEYTDLTQFDVVIELEHGRTGTAVWEPHTFDDLHNLPDGAFLVDGEEVTASDYQARIDTDYPCVERAGRG